MAVVYNFCECSTSLMAKFSVQALVLKGATGSEIKKKGQYLKGCFKEKEMVKASSAVMFS